MAARQILAHVSASESPCLQSCLTQFSVKNFSQGDPVEVGVADAVCVGVEENTVEFGANDMK